MNAFLQKLKENSQNGSLDFVWKYNDGTKKYTFVIPKHYLNGMSLDFSGGIINFPNGAAIVFDESEMSELKKVLDISIDRTVQTSMTQYVSENPDQVQTSDPTKQPIEPTQSSTDTEPDEKDDKNVPLES